MHGYGGKRQATTVRPVRQLGLGHPLRWAKHVPHDCCCMQFGSQHNNVRQPIHTSKLSRLAAHAVPAAQVSLAGQGTLDILLAQLRHSHHCNVVRRRQGCGPASAYRPHVWAGQAGGIRTSTSRHGCAWGGGAGCVYLWQCGCRAATGHSDVQSVGTLHAAPHTGGQAVQQAQQVRLAAVGGGVQGDGRRVSQQLMVGGWARATR